MAKWRSSWCCFFPLIDEDDRKINFFEGNDKTNTMRLSKIIFPNSSLRTTDNYELNTMVDISKSVAHDNNMILHSNHFFPTEWPTNFDINTWISIREQIIVDITNIVLQTEAIISLQELNEVYELVIETIIIQNLSPNEKKDIVDLYNEGENEVRINLMIIIINILILFLL